MIVTHKMSGGGCERVIAQLLNCFARDGIECKLVTECGVPVVLRPAGVCRADISDL